jgi:hypothetical protein
MAGASFGPSGLSVPTGNTAQRPSTPLSGSLRFNTDTNQFELYTGTQWINVYFGT